MIVDLGNVTVRFGDVKAVDGIALRVGGGEVVALLGANGGGKSTTLRLIAGILRPGTARGTILGHPISQPRKIRAEVGYLPQGASLPPHLRVAEVLQFYAQIHGLPNPRAAIASVVERFNLAPVLPRRVAALSGGWYRRVQMACAIIHTPALVLLDEPTNGLDAVARHDLWHQISNLAEAGVAVIIATHDHGEAGRVQRAAFMVAGRFVAEGTPAQVAAAAPGHVWHCPAASPLGALKGVPGVLGGYRDGDRLRLYTRHGFDPEQLPPLDPLAPTLSDAAFLFAAHQSPMTQAAGQHP